MNEKVVSPAGLEKVDASEVTRAIATLLEQEGNVSTVFGAPVKLDTRTRFMRIAARLESRKQVGSRVAVDEESRANLLPAARGGGGFVRALRRCT